MVYKGDSMKKKSAFTMIEIIIIIIVMWIMMLMIPFRMQSLENHTQLSLVSQQREDIRNRTLLRMRQWRIYDTAIITLQSEWVVVVYSWWVKGQELWTGSIEQEKFAQLVTITSANSTVWNMQSYDIACNWPTNEIKLSLWTMQVCYIIDNSSCTMKRLVCGQ